MGRETKEEKLSLMEFLYKDHEIISSLYSQIFGGDLQSIEKAVTSEEKTSINSEISLALAKGNWSSDDSIGENLIKNIISKDEKIIELFDELNIKELTKSLNNCKNGKLVKLEADITFRNLDTLKNVLPIIFSSGNLPNDFLDMIPNVNDGNSLKMLLDFICDNIGKGLEFEVTTKLHEKIQCSINEQNLTNDINNIIKTFNSKYLGKWTIIGIFDNLTPKIDHSSSNHGDMREVIDETEKGILETLYPRKENNFIIKPIIIYRILNY